MPARKMILLGLAAVFLGTILVADVREQNVRDDRANNRRKNWIEGTWRGALTFVSLQESRTSRGPHAALTGGAPPPIEVLFTFTPGHNKTEGAVFDSNSFQLTPNPVCTQDQGVWEKVGERSYIATHYAYCFDETSVPAGDPDGYVKVRDAITLSQDGNSFTINQYVEGFDTEGTQNFSASGSGEATRVVAEAPPAP